MSMGKKEFIALADMIRLYNERNTDMGFTISQIAALARFCKSQNYGFKQDRWFDYIAGECGPSGGQVKKAKVLDFEVK